MTTTIGTVRDVIDMLNNLIRLDFDAIEAYQSAIDQLDHAETIAKFIAFKDDHERHTQEIGRLVRHLGGQPALQRDAKAILTHGKVVLQGLTGDRALLQAMQSNEDDTNEAYEQALARDDLTADLRDLLEHNLADEHRHRDWIGEHLAQR